MSTSIPDFSLDLPTEPENESMKLQKNESNLNELLKNLAVIYRRNNNLPFDYNLNDTDVREYIKKLNNTRFNNLYRITERELTKAVFGKTDEGGRRRTRRQRRRHRRTRRRTAYLRPKRYTK